LRYEVTNEMLSLKSASLFESSSRILPIELIEYANTPQEISITMITKSLSCMFTGVISPYPTVIIVTTDQYKDRIY